jgi:carbon-monoxide dehydrogenase large subunit
VCFAIEVLMDALARELKLAPDDIRRKNLVRPEQMPFVNITNKIFDSGNYIECLDRAVATIDLPAIRARQAAGEADGRKIGVGLAIYCEQGAHGTSVYAGWGIPMIPGFEQATARLTPDGGLELRIGVQSHGQSLETTLAQIAHEELGVATHRIKVVHGDTALTPYSTGTWGSRCIVMAGGAVGAACEVLAGRIRRIAGHQLQADPNSIELANGIARGKGGEISLKEIGTIWYRRPQDLPPDVDPAGLEVTQGYKTQRDTGTFSYACHAVVVSVDTELGAVELIDYKIVEDGGVLINPMVVDGQIYGGTAQGIGTALYEEMRYDDNGQPLAATFADYHLPGAAEVPPIVVDHMQHASPISRFGQKGIGEGGAIAPPAAIANAVNDALAPLGVEVDALPITPGRLLAKLAHPKPERRA